MKTCTKCGLDYPLDSFPNRAASKDGKDTKCRECFRAYHRDIYNNSDKRKSDIRKNSTTWRVNVKAWLDDIKIQSGCVDCGYNKHPEALQFDHVSDNKSANIADMKRNGFSKARIEEEIAKCEIVCANCHAIRTASRRCIPSV